MPTAGTVTARNAIYGFCCSNLMKNCKKDRECGSTEWRTRLWICLEFSPAKLVLKTFGNFSKAGPIAKSLSYSVYIFAIAVSCCDRLRVISADFLQRGNLIERIKNRY
jgi:hypothetical protein